MAIDEAIASFKKESGIGIDSLVRLDETKVGKVIEIDKVGGGTIRVWAPVPPDPITEPREVIEPPKDYSYQGETYRVMVINGYGSGGP